MDREGVGVEAGVTLRTTILRNVSNSYDEISPIYPNNTNVSLYTLDYINPRTFRLRVLVLPLRHRRRTGERALQTGVGENPLLQIRFTGLFVTRNKS